MDDVDREDLSPPVDPIHAQTHCQPADRRHSKALCLALILVNFSYHAVLLTAVRWTDGWIEFEPWFRMLACWAPIFVTVAIVAGLLCFRRCSLIGSMWAVTVSVTLAFLHSVLIDLASAIV